MNAHTVEAQIFTIPDCAGCSREVDGPWAHHAHLEHNTDAGIIRLKLCLKCWNSFIALAPAQVRPFWNALFIRWTKLFGEQPAGRA